MSISPDTAKAIVSMWEARGDWLGRENSGQQPVTRCDLNFIAASLCTIACLLRDIADPAGTGMAPVAAEPERTPDVKQLLDHVDIVEVIGGFLTLNRVGASYRANYCPFHDGGKHQNFAVIPLKGIYYCFVCHESGTAIDFLMKVKGMKREIAIEYLQHGH